MDTFARRMRLVVDLGLLIMLLGLGGLLLNAWVEYLRTPGTTLLDGYWRGREPWTSLGVGTVITGSALALLAALLVALVDGSWIRRILALVAVAASALWWLVAIGAVPLPRYQPVAPITLAYSLPEDAALLLVLPALLAAAVALTPRRAAPTSRMAPIHSQPPRPRDQ